jgi:hypothetical protein
MVLARWMTMLATVTTLLGCGVADGGGAASDASSERHGGMDAGADHATPKDTLARDATGKDSRGEDASTRDTGAANRGAADAGRQDATAKDAAPHEASPADAGPGDAPPKDAARQDASGGHERATDAAGGDGSAKDASSRDSTKEGGGTEDASRRDASREEGGAGATDASAGDAASLEGGSGDAVPADAADAGTKTPGFTSIAISPLRLSPTFSTTVHDYYVRCSAGDNTLTVAMTAAPDSTIALAQPTTTTASTENTVTLTVSENGAIVVDVTTAGTTAAYWIRCLPHDFPRLQMTLHADAGTATPGYYLVGNLTVVPGDRGYAIALDGNGVPVWYGTTMSGAGAVNVDNIVPGTISYVGDLGVTFGDSSGEYELHDLDAGTTTHVEPSGVPLDEHELRALPNGDYLVFGNPIVTGVNLTGLDGYGANEDIIDCEIQEVDPTGMEVWEWSAMDHLDPVLDSIWPESMTMAGTTVVDVFHCNSIDVAPDGDLLVSARQTDSVFMVSRSSGAILWKMGGSTYTKDGAPYVTVVDDPMTSFHGQHDARLLASDEVSMFDDQTERAGPARAVIYTVNLTAGTATMAWQHEGTATSAAMGSFRIESDGARVIGWGMNVGGFVAFTELDLNGNDLLDFSFPDGTQSYRAIKVPTSAFDINLLRATAGAD